MTCTDGFRLISDHYVYGITTEPEARRMASHHDAQHRRNQR